MTALTTKERARAALPEAGLSDSDTEIDRQISAMSRQICDYLRVPQTLDGRVTLAVERVQEKLEFRRYTETFYLSRTPLVYVGDDPQFHLLMLGDDVLTNSEIEVLSPDGLCRFIDTDENPVEAYGPAIIEYTGGYNLPSMTTPVTGAATMPEEIESAMFSLLKGGAAAARRDPSVRAETSEEVDSFTYFAEGAMPVAWREAAAYIEPLRRIYL